MMWRLWGMVGAAALLAAAVCLDASGARADKVGVAAAVNPDAFSSLAGSPQTQLNIGKSIFFNERINTTTSGLVQVLLVDGSTFTVGPGSDLVINKFVYDPKKGTGQITASFSKGVMRFVGGKISKSDNAVSINTPAGALAVRGCIILGNIIDRSNYQFIMPYGVYMQLNNDKVWEGGYGIFRLNGRSEIRPATATDLKVILSGLNNGNNSGGGETQSNSGGAKPGTAFLLAETANEIVSEATATEIQNTIATPQDTACTGAGCNPQPETPGNSRHTRAELAGRLYGVSGFAEHLYDGRWSQSGDPWRRHISSTPKSSRRAVCRRLHLDLHRRRQPLGGNRDRPHRRALRRRELCCSPNNHRRP